MLDTHLKALDICFFEVTEAFRGLEDSHVWTRPSGVLLSVGELAGHVAYWEAVRFAGEGADGSSTRDLSTCKLTSPLLDPRFGYYSTTLPQSQTEEQMAMGAERVRDELLRVHRESMACLQALNPSLQSPAPYRAPESNFDELLHNVAFHVAYHTGQMYSVRHLLGETTPDN